MDNQPSAVINIYMAAKSTTSRFMVGSLIAGALGAVLGLFVLGALIYLAPSGGTQSQSNETNPASGASASSPAPRSSASPTPGKQVAETEETPAADSSPATENTPRGTVPTTAAERTPQVSTTPRIVLTTPRRTPPVIAADTPRSAPPRNTPRGGGVVTIPTVHP